MKDLTKVKQILRRKVPAFAKRVQPLYEALHWEWAGVSGIYEVPSVKRIEHCLMELINELKDIDYWVETGGLRVFCEPEDEHELHCGIEFVVKDSEWILCKEEEAI